MKFKQCFCAASYCIEIKDKREINRDILRKTGSQLRSKIHEKQRNPNPENNQKIQSRESRDESNPIVIGSLERRNQIREKHKPKSC
jgi:hypothetical protein